jgi:hypothetical protein
MYSTYGPLKGKTRKYEGGELVFKEQLNLFKFGHKDEVPVSKSKTCHRPYSLTLGNSEK